MKTIIIFLLVFSVIVIIHEFGHFIFAKRAGVLVREFAIGMGPKLFQYKGEETVYTLRLLPLGGYVRMAGLEDMNEQLAIGQIVYLTENEEGLIEEISLQEGARDALPVEVIACDLNKELYIDGQAYGEDVTRRFYLTDKANFIDQDGTCLRLAPLNRQFQEASLGNRILTNFAGPMNNFILSIIAFTLLAFLQDGVMTDAPIVGEVVSGSAAQVANLRTGDTILSIDGEIVDSFEKMQEIVSQKPKQKILLKINRSGEEKELKFETSEVTLDNGNRIGQIGIKRSMDRSFSAKLFYGFKQTFNYIVLFFATIVGMFRRGLSINDFGGPVYIYQATSQVASYGFTALLAWTATLSVNLGLMNLLPIPALDGGKLLFNFIEGLRGKPVSRKTEGIVNLVGIVLVLVLMLAVTWNDIMRFF